MGGHEAERVLRECQVDEVGFQSWRKLSKSGTAFLTRPSALQTRRGCIGGEQLAVGFSRVGRSVTR